ncbi:septum formation initiator family protein [Chitinophagales bacterium]|nr:septum formation initiator family protein [Chitinophagales bacterium]
MQSLRQALDNSLLFLPDFLRNRYCFVLACFGIWMLFIDGNDLVTQNSMRMQLQAIQQEQAQLQEDIGDSKRQLDELKNNPLAQEKVARERYRMKRKNEQVFSLIPKAN